MLIMITIGFHIVKDYYCLLMIINDWHVLIIIIIIKNNWQAFLVCFPKGFSLPLASRLYFLSPFEYIPVDVSHQTGKRNRNKMKLASC